MPRNRYAVYTNRVLFDKATIALHEAVREEQVENLVSAHDLYTTALLLLEVILHSNEEGLVCSELAATEVRRLVGGVHGRMSKLQHRMRRSQSPGAVQPGSSPMSSSAGSQAQHADPSA